MLRKLQTSFSAKCSSLREFDSRNSTTLSTESADFCHQLFSSYFSFIISFLSHKAMRNGVSTRGNQFYEVNVYYLFRNTPLNNVIKCYRIDFIIYLFLAKKNTEHKLIFCSFIGRINECKDESECIDANL